MNINRYCVLLSMILLLPIPSHAVAGGGLVLTEDACILNIDFYSAHFTAYQPETSGNKQFCTGLPDTGPTIFVLDYLHQSLKEVAVSFRIIHDVTGQGRFAKLKHVEALQNIEQHTVFYQPPVIEADASLQVEYDFKMAGAYIVIVTAGHPTSDKIYTAIFPFEAGGSSPNYLIAIILVFAGAASFVWIRRIRARTRTSKRKNPAGDSGL